jgi:hypothetical protein
MSVRLQKSSSPRSEQLDSRHNQSFSPILNQLHADRGTLGSATTSSCPMWSSMLGSTPTLHRTIVQVRNRININSNPKAWRLLACTPTRSAKSSWMVTCYTYTEATQDLKIFTCRTRQYVREYNCLNNGLHQPAYNYSNYSSTTTSYSATTRHPATRAIHQPCRALRLLVTRSYELYLNPTMRRDYSSLDCSGSTSTTPRIRVPRHVVWLVTRLVAPLVVDYSASRNLVVDYFASAARSGVSARHAARHATCRAARRRLLRLHRASGCLGTSCGSSRGSSRRS